ncbi:MAG: type II secretion system secretin GspD [Chromatiales bacterium]|jgi:general secretion pathway protein D
MHKKLLIAIFFLAFSCHASAQTEKIMTLNLNDADIRAFITTVSEMTGKNFIIDPRVQGRVTVVFSTPTTSENIYDIFLSVLKVHGFAAVPSGNAIKIVPNTGAKQDSIPTVIESEQNNNDKIITQVIQIKHADASQLASTLAPLLPQQSSITAHANSNMLVITDTAANVNRLLTIIRRIDQPTKFGIQIVKLEHAQADNVLAALSPVIKSELAKNKSSAQGQSISVDDRTNSLILNGEPDWRKNIIDAITQLDTEVEDEGNTEVIYLHYANAKSLSEVLKSIGDKIAKSDQDKGANNSNIFDIQADEATNSLVLTAPPGLMKSLTKVIQKLDIRRVQVHIEAIIVELKDDKAIELGVEWQTSLPDDGIYSGTRLPLTGASGSNISTFPGTIGSGFNFGYLSGGDIRTLLKAFSSNGDNNILSTPSLVTLDNEEASIHVGKNVPFVTGQYTNNDSSSSTNPFQTIERHDVGIKLNVTPHINEGDTIELKIEQEVSSVEPGTSAEGLITNKRTINTTVLVDDGEIVVLGGLIDDALTETQSKVPVLGDIPGLNLLFSSKRTIREKKNLMVFLRPQILRDKMASQKISLDEYLRIRNQQIEKNSGQVQLLPGEKTPLLPEIEKSPDRENSTNQQLSTTQRAISAEETSEETEHLTFPSSAGHTPVSINPFLDF